MLPARHDDDDDDDDEEGEKLNKRYSMIISLEKF